MAGGQEFARPDYADASPPKPIRQGDCASPNYVDEHTFESGQAPDARAPIESDWMGLVGSDGLDGKSMDMDRVASKGPGEGIRGFRTTPVGGTYNPGNSGK